MRVDTPAKQNIQPSYPEVLHPPRVETLGKISKILDYSGVYIIVKTVMYCMIFQSGQDSKNINSGAPGSLTPTPALVWASKFSRDEKNSKTDNDFSLVRSQVRVPLCPLQVEVNCQTPPNIQKLYYESQRIKQTEERKNSK